MKALGAIERPGLISSTLGGIDSITSARIGKERWERLYATMVDLYTAPMSYGALRLWWILQREGSPLCVHGSRDPEKT